MRWLTILVVLLASSDAWADSVAFTCGGPRNVQPITRQGACAGFVAKDARGKVVQRVEGGYFVSGTILATPDGKTVAMLHDYPVIDGFQDVPALLFFRDGKEVARYAMTDLVQRMRLVTWSVSHVRWLAPGSRTDLALGSTLELSTTSQRTYSFDVATGKQLSADDTEDWKRCELIVYAPDRVPAPIDGAHTIAEPRFAKGTAKAPLVLRASPGVEVGSGTTLCVMAAQSGWVATKNIPVMLNALPR